MWLLSTEPTGVYTFDIINMATIDTLYVQMVSQVLMERRYVDQRDTPIVIFQCMFLNIIYISYQFKQCYILLIHHFSFLFAELLQWTITKAWPLIAIHTTLTTVTSGHKVTVHRQFTSTALVGTTALFSENKNTVSYLGILSNVYAIISIIDRHEIHYNRFIIRKIAYFHIMHLISIFVLYIVLNIAEKSLFQ